MSEKKISWSEGVWLTEPPLCYEKEGALVAEALKGSDYWQTTMYGFQRDNGHSLVVPWSGGDAVEVSFHLTGFENLYDQAGLMLWSHSGQWIKAGVEINDSVPHVGAVVTAGYSDWSLSPVPEWEGKIITIRASRLRDAVIIRARAEQQPWRTIRVCRLHPEEDWQVGPYLCAPTNAGLQVAFTGWRWTKPDTDVHVQPLAEGSE
ncbi:regulation of enolase protein 1 (concanavalin A-like superfamily) [Paenibacillus forsythiae]|uniref:Regulation of enolase protein 1 (Concanavalin A-like superfamily) n=2 Tax=Paenibacillus forsythiae TaxID=365616 RepID=A0ABU3HEH4_9BACL|nr:DUF1349 domain-containing protein [Paenibacillus forsythiae]MDT3429231.1 regulation of enolase protein 1 (concanavalin A-like superfamily) [Paenibacillus forsythiae]